MSPVIGIVEDDLEQRRNYAEALQKRGYRVDTYDSRSEALKGFQSNMPDLAILDVVLGKDFDGGFQLCRELLFLQADIPVIFLTSRVDEIDQIFGLRLGAWDYQTKPVSLNLLVERVASLLQIKGARDQHEKPKGVIEQGDLKLDSQRVQISWKNIPIVLTVSECTLLAAIVKKNGGVVRYDELAAATRQTVVTNNTINTHIRHIRAKFKQHDPDFDKLTNVYGAGYCWRC